jgi:20S proteasome alpha/beta subunit
LIFLIRYGKLPQLAASNNTKQIVRNNFLAERGIALPKATSTGTTIVGCLFEDGIVLGADTRATEGDIVADKNCEKVKAYDACLVVR